MRKRFTRLLRLDHMFYAQEAPVLISGGTLLREEESGNLLCQVTLHSLSEKEIRMVQVAVQMLDAEGNILGKEIATPAVTVGACYGDALMAALGVKYEGFEDYASLTNFIRTGEVYTPDPAAHEAYKKYQAVYDVLYGATKDLAHELGSL